MKNIFYLLLIILSLSACSNDNASEFKKQENEEYTYS